MNASHTFLTGILIFSACSMFPSNRHTPEEISRENIKSNNDTPPTPTRNKETEKPLGRLELSDLLLECEKHIRTWKKLAQLSPTESNMGSRKSLEDAFALLVQKHRNLLDNQALYGEHRNRRIASASLGFSRDSSTIPILLNNLSDPQSQVVAQAVFGLGILAEPSTPTGPILAVLNQEYLTSEIAQNTSFTAARLAEIIKEDKENNLEAIFFQLIKRPEPAIRAQSVAGLGKIKAPSAELLLIDLLTGDTHHSVRAAAAYALGEIGKKSSAEALLVALNDPNELTKGTARASLVKIFKTDYGFDLKKWQSITK